MNADKYIQQMNADELIQQMRVTPLPLVRTRLLLLADKYPDAYAAVEELFAPVPENRKRWCPLVAKGLRELRKSLRRA